MKLFEEIVNRINFDPELTQNGTKIVLYSKKLAYFENVKKIFAFNSTELVLLTKGNKVQIIGENLMIQQYGEGDLLLQGDMHSVAFVE